MALHSRRPKIRPEILSHVMSEDLIKFGFESEFVGRLPVRAVFERLTKTDLFEILKNPNNPIILGKKLDFAAYDIDIKFGNEVLAGLARSAYSENTGARGLVSAVENALLTFERRMPSMDIRLFPATQSVLDEPKQFLKKNTNPDHKDSLQADFDHLSELERESIKKYVHANKDRLSTRYNLTLTESRINLVADFYSKYILDIDRIFSKLKGYYDEAMKVELIFLKDNEISIVLENDAVDMIIESLAYESTTQDDLQKRLTDDFALGFKLIREKTGKDRFFITRQALFDPEKYINRLIQTELKNTPPDTG